MQPFWARLLPRETMFPKQICCEPPVAMLFETIVPSSSTKPPRRAGVKMLWLKAIVEWVILSAPVVWMAGCAVTVGEVEMLLLIVELTISWPGWFGYRIAMTPGANVIGLPVTVLSETDVRSISDVDAAPLMSIPPTTFPRLPRISESRMTIAPDALIAPEPSPTDCVIRVR